MSELSEKHKRFCLEYVKRGNGTRAYKAVYPDSSIEAANVSAARLLAKASIKAEIQRINSNLMDELGLTKARITEMMLQTYELAGKVYKTGDQVKAVELLGREHGMFGTSAKVETDSTQRVVYTLDMGNGLDDDDLD